MTGKEWDWGRAALALFVIAAALAAGVAALLQHQEKAPNGTGAPTLRFPPALNKLPEAVARPPAVRDGRQVESVFIRNSALQSPGVGLASGAKTTVQVVNRDRQGHVVWYLEEDEAGKWVAKLKGLRVPAQGTKSFQPSLAADRRGLLRCMTCEGPAREAVLASLPEGYRSVALVYDPVRGWSSDRLVIDANEEEVDDTGHVRQGVVLFLRNASATDLNFVILQPYRLKTAPESRYRYTVASRDTVPAGKERALYFVFGSLKEYAFLCEGACTGQTNTGRLVVR